jgi:hypothetical protein
VCDVCVCVFVVCLCTINAKGVPSGATACIRCPARASVACHPHGHIQKEKKILGIKKVPSGASACIRCPARASLVHASHTDTHTCMHIHTNADIEKHMQAHYQRHKLCTHTKKTERHIYTHHTNRERGKHIHTHTNRMIERQSETKKRGQEGPKRRRSREGRAETRTDLDRAH